MWENVIKTARKHKAAAASTVILFLIVLIAIFAHFVSPNDPYAYDTARRFEPASSDFPGGTDQMGRCVLSRVIWGARVSLQVALVATMIGAVIGLTLGVIAGFSGGTLESLIMRIVDVGMSFPFILLAILITALFGAGLRNVMLAVGIARGPTMARIAHAATRQVKENEYIEASEALGASSVRTIFKHVLPNILAPVIVRATLDVAVAILAESGLSFLGLGITPPTPTWGGIIAAGRQHIRRAPWIAMWPGIAIFITVMTANLLGDGVRDYFDPKVSI